MISRMIKAGEPPLHKWIQAPKVTSLTFSYVCTLKGLYRTWQKSILNCEPNNLPFVRGVDVGNDKYFCQGHRCLLGIGGNRLKDYLTCEGHHSAMMKDEKYVHIRNCSKFKWQPFMHMEDD